MFEGLHIGCVLMQALVVLRISLLLQHVTPEATTTESVVKEQQPEHEEVLDMALALEEAQGDYEFLVELLQVCSCTCASVFAPLIWMWCEVFVPDCVKKVIEMANAVGEANCVLMKVHSGGGGFMHVRWVVCGVEAHMPCRVHVWESGSGCDA